MYNLSLELNLTVISARLAQKGRIGGRVSWAGQGEGARGSNTYVLRCRVRVELFFFSLTTKEDLALSTASVDS